MPELVVDQRAGAPPRFSCSPQCAIPRYTRRRIIRSTLDRRPRPAVGARRRLVVQPVGDALERPPVDAPLERPQHERCPCDRGRAACRRPSRSRTARPARCGRRGRPRGSRLVSQPSLVRSRKYSAIIRLICRKIRPSAVVKSNSGSVALANSARWSVSSFERRQPADQRAGEAIELVDDDPAALPRPDAAHDPVEDRAGPSSRRRRSPPDRARRARTPRSAAQRLERPALHIRADVALAAAIADAADTDVAVDRAARDRRAKAAIASDRSPRNRA